MRRPRRMAGELTRLDELLDGVGVARGGSRPTRRIGWILLRSVVIAAVVAGALYGLGLLLGLRIPYVLEFVVVLAFVVGREILLVVQPPPPPTPRPREDAEPTAYLMPDRPFVDAKRWESRLEWIVGDPSSFVRIVTPAMTEIVDERLRLAHGITRAGDPERAREIMGQRLWDFLHATELRKAPSPRELATMVDELERL